MEVLVPGMRALAHGGTLALANRKIPMKMYFRRLMVLFMAAPYRFSALKGIVARRAPGDRRPRKSYNRLKPGAFSALRLRQGKLALRRRNAKSVPEQEKHKPGGGGNR